MPAATSIARKGMACAEVKLWGLCVGANSRCTSRFGYIMRARSTFKALTVTDNSRTRWRL